MEGSRRKYLTGSIMLSRSEDGSSPEEYFIKSVIGEGGSTVCYEATRTLKDGIIETGKLKEFYPMDAIVGNQAWYYSLERLPNGQLVFGEGSSYKFDEMCQDYISTYKLLRKVMVDNPKNEILKGYIQHGEILYGTTKLPSPFFTQKSNENEDRHLVLAVLGEGVLCNVGLLEGDVLELSHEEEARKAHAVSEEECGLNENYPKRSFRRVNKVHNENGDTAAGYRKAVTDGKEINELIKADGAKNRAYGKKNTEK